jgi:hypothetical protein
VNLPFKSRRRALAGAVGVCAAVGGCVAALSGFAGGGDFGCIPVLSARNLVWSEGWTEKGWGDVSPGHGPVDSVVASSSTASTVYVTTADRELFIGSGSPVVWRKRRTLIPGRLYASFGTGADTLYAAEQALYRSHDQGRSWRRLSCGLILDDLAISVDEKTIYLGANAGASSEGRVLGGLYRTTDGGHTWKRFTHFPMANPAEPLVYAVAVSPRNPRQVVIGMEFGGALVSTDGGESWRFSPVEDVGGGGLDGPQITSLAFGPGPHPQLWLGSSQNGVFRADETGRRWTATGLSFGAARVVADHANWRIAYALTSGGPRRTVDNGIQWQPIRGLPTDEDAGFSASASDGTVFSWAGRQIFRSRDHGATWTRLSALPGA